MWLRHDSSESLRRGRRPRLGGSDPFEVPRWRIVLLAATLVLAWPTLVEAQKPPDKPPPGGHSSSAKPPPEKKSTSPSKSKSSWSQQADTVCRDGTHARAAVLDDVQRKPPPSVRKALLQVLSGTVKVEGTMITRLGKLHVSGSSHAGAARALGLFRQRWKQDASLVKRLEHHWDTNLLERQTRADRATNARLAKLWSGVGSSGCAEYFRALNGE